MKLLGFVFLAKGRRAFATGVTRSRGAGLVVLRRGERYVKSREGHQSNCDSVDSVS
jgi:hypothetical protein